MMIGGGVDSSVGEDRRRSLTYPDISRTAVVACFCRQIDNGHRLKTETTAAASSTKKYEKKKNQILCTYVHTSY